MYLFVIALKIADKIGQLVGENELAIERVHSLSAVQARGIIGTTIHPKNAASTRQEKESLWKPKSSERPI